jgi:hypothetical protein
LYNITTMSKITPTCLTCTNPRSKYDKRCLQCIKIKPNICPICDCKCGSFKSCFECRDELAAKLEEEYDGNYCDDCYEPCKNFVCCYSCTMKRKELYTGLYCKGEGCNKQSNTFQFCYMCNQKKKKKSL